MQALFILSCCIKAHRYLKLFLGSGRHLQAAAFQSSNYGECSACQVLFIRLTISSSRRRPAAHFVVGSGGGAAYLNVIHHEEIPCNLKEEEMDVVIPIVFPDYKVTVEVQKTKVDVFPWTTFDDFHIPAYTDRISNLGHAGILFASGKTGTTKYYEYGRYDPPKNLGLVVKARNLPDVVIKNGKIELASLKKPLSFISRISGQSGRVQGVYIQVENKYEAMLGYAELRKSQNALPNRTPYHLITNSCIHFVKEITKKAEVATPWMVDPRPNSYMGKFRDDFPDLDYKNDVLKIEGVGTF